MPDAEFNFEQKARKSRLFNGAFVKITKTEIKKNHTSSAEIGTSKQGHIGEYIELDRPLYFEELGNTWVTSELKDIFIKNDKTYIETETSIYEVNLL